jgi:hypothetical protein
MAALHVTIISQLVCFVLGYLMEHGHTDVVNVWRLSEESLFLFVHHAKIREVIVDQSVFLFFSFSFLLVW